MNWSEFMEEARDLAATVSSSAGARAISPMLYLATPVATFGHVVDPIFFEPENAPAFVDTVKRLVAVNSATRVAWMFEGTFYARLQDGSVDMTPALCVCCVEREREETWTAQLLPIADDLRLLGPWLAWPANETLSTILQPIQEAMR